MRLRLAARGPEGTTGGRMHRFVAFAIVFCFFATAPEASDKRPLTVDDCVRVRRVVQNEVKLSPDGRRTAYLLKSPNLTTNKNDYQLWVRDMKEITHRENGRLLFQSDELSEVRWVADGRY